MSLTSAAQSFPAGFHAQDISTNGTTLHVRSGGAGPAVVLMHGYGETGDMWAAMAADLVRDHLVIVPDLRGLGLSAKPADGFDKKCAEKNKLNTRMEKLHFAFRMYDLDGDDKINAFCAAVRPCKHTYKILNSITTCYRAAYPFKHKCN